ncbi:PEGA domain-containing protein [Methanoregula formicica]|uniref:PEGA domain-containing protein n=1 Tax=Methanoregula formicica (strain DSM 22288 / NBRC 105244 / SMSP) TaxID=593750 RepID=L0HFH0_METFS|nr:PEGA domain-containing protein [Methanoregula formicica]AGB02740.1 PEGA domain-containing protein [Methanoregula formicica SMSP]
MARYSVSHSRMAIILLCMALFLTVPVQAFTADSLDITIDKNGDATAVFRFTLEGLIENAIPQSMLEEQLIKGLSSSSEPPTLVSMDRSRATIILKKFASTYDTPQGTDYQTSSMDFRKAEIALQNSAVSSVISADFSPATATLIFSDGYVRTFSDVESLPSITHTIIDPVKAASAKAAATTTATLPATPAVPAQTGAINVTSSPDGIEIWLDGASIGTTPAVFRNIPAGAHSLTFKKEGYTSVTKDVTVSDGGTIRLSVYLAPVEATPTQAPVGALAAGAAIALCIALWAVRRR